LSETTDFLTDQLRTLIVLLRTLQSLPTHAKQGSMDEMRKLYLEELVAKRMVDASLLDDKGEQWTEEKKRHEKIGSLEDLRKLDGQS
jgi:hypothetical protein